MDNVIHAPCGRSNCDGNCAVDVVNQPPHYTDGPVECIDVIRMALGDARFVAFCLGNAMKYRHRAGLKGDASQDLAKAKWYEQMAAHVELDGVDDPREKRSQ